MDSNIGGGVPWGTFTGLLFGQEEDRFEQTEQVGVDACDRSNEEAVQMMEVRMRKIVSVEDGENLRVEEDTRLVQERACRLKMILQNHITTLLN